MLLSVARLGSQQRPIIVRTIGVIKARTKRVPDDDNVTRLFFCQGFDECVEYAGGRQKFREEHQLSVGRGLRLRIPMHVHAAAERVDHHRFIVYGLRYLPNFHRAQGPLPFHQSGECARFARSPDIWLSPAFLRIPIAVSRITVGLRS